MNDEVPGEGDFGAGRRRGEFDDITWRILAVVATPGVFFGVATTTRIRLSGVPRIQAPPPKLVEYFGKALPYAMTGLLVVYALRNTPILTGSHGIPELIACAVITLLHLWKRNMLLSTAGGTAVYMLLIQLVL